MNTRKHSTEKIIIFLIYHDNFIIKQYKQTIFSNLNIDCQGKVLSFYRRNVAYLKQYISHIGKIEQLQFESTPFTPLFSMLFHSDFTVFQEQKHSYYLLKA